MKKYQPEASLIAVMAGLIILSVGGISFGFWLEGKKTEAAMIWIYLVAGMFIGWSWRGTRGW